MALFNTYLRRNQTQRDQYGLSEQSKLWDIKYAIIPSVEK